MVDEVFNVIASRELVVEKASITGVSTISGISTHTAQLILDHDTTAASPSGQSLHIENDGAVGNDSILQVSSATTNGRLLRIWGSAANSKYTSYFIQDSATATGGVINIQNDGTGSAILIDNNNTGTALEIDMDVSSSASTEYAVSITCDVSAGGGSPAGIDLSSFAAGEITINFPAGTASAVDPGSANWEDGWINIGVGGTLYYIPYCAVA